MDHFDLKHEASTTVKAAVECSGEVKGGSSRLPFLRQPGWVLLDGPMRLMRPTGGRFRVRPSDYSLFRLCPQNLDRD